MRIDTIFETKQETSIDEIESNVWKIMLGIGRLIAEWIVKNRRIGYTQKYQHHLEKQYINVML